MKLFLNLFLIKNKKVTVLKSPNYHFMKQTVILLFLFTATINAQKLNLKQFLPQNKTLKKGVLENGLTYYIYNTKETKNVASYYMIHNVGSVLENENQQGLAHFLEHMAFNGSKNFKGKGILNTLEKNGLVFGRDINASTGLEETVFKLKNVPTTTHLIDTSLLILHDWTHFLELSENEIDAERGVVKEEWRLSQNGENKEIEEKLRAFRYNNTPYANRLPIGKMSVIDNFEYQTLHNFYNDWYRTDLQAIAVIGDVDVKDIEKRIIQQFSKIPVSKSKKKRFNIALPKNKNLRYKLIVDDEATRPYIEFWINHSKLLKPQTVGDFKEILFEKIAKNIFSERITDISQKPNSPFTGGGISISNRTRVTKSFEINIQPKPNKQKEAFTLFVTELHRVLKFGFTQSEIERSILKINSIYENKIQEIGNEFHGTISNKILQNYIANTTITDVKKEYELVKSICSNLNPNEITSRIKKYYTKENRSLLVTGINDAANLTKNDAIQIIESIEKDKTLTAYIDKFKGKKLLSNIKINDGNIISETCHKTIKASTFTLSNGVRVHYKFTDKDKDLIQIEAVSKGGLSLVKDSDLPSAKMVRNVIHSSGLNTYSKSDLKKILAGKTATTYIKISQLTENISGSSTVKDAETLLKMIHLRFVKPHFDKNSYNKEIASLKRELKSKKTSLNSKIQDSLIIALYGENNPKRKLFNESYINAISLNKIKDIYSQRFNNAADFDFFITGNISIKNLKPLLKKYIGSIPTTLKRENWKNNAPQWLSNNISKNIYLKMESPKCVVKMAYKNVFDYSLKNTFLASILGDLLTIRYRETLREEEGGTYGAGVGGYFYKYPVSEASLAISFECNPVLSEKLIAITKREIQKIANGTIVKSNLDEIITSYLKDRKEELNSNDNSIHILKNFILEKYHINDPKYYEDILTNISSKDIQQFTKKLLKNAKKYEIIIKPKRGF